jgi:2-oxoglutarate dehydrogenase complex dehydrogenase (E1) component-like enzyme
MVTTKNVATKPATKPTENGAVSKTTTQTAAEKLPLIVPEKKQEPKTELKKSVPTIEQKLKKLEEINELVERREVVTDAIQNLAGFYISPEGTGCNLRLQDSKGKTFAIAHPAVIGEMVSMAKAKLADELNRIENQIDFNI